MRLSESVGDAIRARFASVRARRGRGRCLLACEDIPITWRANAAVATYLCLRDGEQRSLR
jgi:hypothetical protein